MYTRRQANKYKLLIGVYSLVFSTLACEPVFAIGWREILFVFVLAAFLIGPPVYKFLRKLEKYRKQKEK